jgi:DNA-binding Xre family transcriptional regulator
VRKISLKRLLDKEKKTMYAVAKETSISYTTIHKLCTKPVASVDLDVLDKLCKNLKCTPNDLLEFEK